MTQPRVAPRLTAALALLLLAVGAGCVREPEAQSCPTGVYCPAGARCALRQAVCIFDGCGDGVLGAGEVCDDGNIIDGDHCSADCKSDETCGNRIVDDAVGEVCDYGDTVPGDGCSADCKSTEECGDGKVDPGEECDTTVESRSCNGDCTFAVHGDGKINAAFGEVCDGDGVGLGNGFDCQWAGCNANCTVSVHGDGWVNPLDGEACDGDGRGAPAPGPGCQSPTCNQNCTLSQPGDGWINPRDGEVCDGDGLGTPPPGPGCQSPTCNQNCTPSVHGDGWVNPQHDEECDGNGLGTFNGTTCLWRTCNADCTASVCGDGKPNGFLVAGAPVEECDDGNADNLDDCKNDCKRNVCGDGLVNVSGPVRTEACDLGSALNGVASCAYGLLSCDLCSDTCEPLPLVTHYCGNDVVDGPADAETCDDARSRACQTCGELDCKIKSIAPAVGTITVSSTAVADGDTMVVDDGVNTAVTFEFSLDAACAVPGSVCVRLAGAPGTTTDGIAGAIRAAFALVAATLAVQPEAPTAGQNPITLINGQAGIVGNTPITTTGTSVAVAPSPGAVVVDGMAGGAGCPLGAPCHDANDCVSGRCGSTSKVCKTR